MSRHRDPTTSLSVQHSPDTAEDGGCRDKCLKFMYDKEKGTYCNRTCKDWAILISFTFTYITFVLAFLCFTLYVYLLYLQSCGQPLVHKRDLLVYQTRGGVGLSIIPMVHKYPILWYSMKEKNYDIYTKALDHVVTEYKNNMRNRNICEEDHQLKKGCSFNISRLGPCKDCLFGYDKGEPCFFVHINRELHWTPLPFTLPPSSNQSRPIPSQVLQLAERSNTPQMWLHCSGVNPWDQEHIGEIKYYPSEPGFNPNYFPYEFVENFSDPLVAVKIIKLSYDVIVEIKCRVWHGEGTTANARLLMYIGHP